ncbi:hypothetical protein CI610_01942 [invertebrate metagenome]|uniref:Uncharacterized protein n=1 Tax=invertebrate metagenome TaxID=1711999 RepID=A0A2H9T7E2_9ZZZZ
MEKFTIIPVHRYSPGTDSRKYDSLACEIYYSLWDMKNSVTGRMALAEISE